MNLENRDEGAVPVQKDVGRHTPGAWRIRLLGSSIRVFAPEFNNAEICKIEKSADRRTSERRLSDARLIASAPDLLEALQELRAVFVCDALDDYSERVDQVMNQVDAAIAKATGTKP